MQLDVVISPDGKVSFVVRKGEYSSAEALLKEIVAGLQAEGIDFAEVGAVERHRHDDPPKVQTGQKVGG